jgi:hypothetical protein
MFSKDTFQFRQDEKIILFIRRHWIFVVYDILIVFFNFIFVTIAIWLLQYFSLIPDLELFGTTLYALSDIFVYCWALFCWLLFAEKMTDYFLDYWIVTNKRIIESELITLFNHKFSTLELQDIEDITVHSQGFWANYFDYGKLNVQTAGTNTEFYAENIYTPAEVEKVIFDAKMEDEKEKRDIEKGEFEQISHRVFKEDHSERDQKELSENFAKQHSISEEIEREEALHPKYKQDFDWAHIDEQEANDPRNKEVIEEVEDKYKKNTDSALRSQE